LTSSSIGNAFNDDLLKAFPDQKRQLGEATEKLNIIERDSAQMADRLVRVPAERSWKIPE